MEQAPDESKSPPSTSYRETYRRHRKLFFVPVILGALAAGFMAFTSGGSYQSTASLWIDTAPPLASSVGASLSPPLTEPPAAAEQGILNELSDDPGIRYLGRKELVAREGSRKRGVDPEQCSFVRGE